MRVRDMTEADIDSVSTLRVRGWQFAYAGLIPQPVLDALSPEEDAARRREHLAEDGSPPVPSLIIEDGGETIGWASWGPYRTDESPSSNGDAELYALYVRPDRIGTGAGRALMTAVLDAATASGAPRILLWVLRDNARARRFYEVAGFTTDGEEAGFEIDGTTVPEVRYVRTLARHP
ncbi:GNAT family N-acetyltransferase [Streptomyces sp. NPDC048172]|uniref:GNAT family N-acetyltransferase n=1 Tax=Streptomyces sp. NPDC048172 TaxID=3365505 RepID=UPI0037183C6D